MMEPAARTDHRNAGVGVAPSGHRLPAATRLGRVRLQVADLERSLAWYERVLGLGVAARDGVSAQLVARGGQEPLVELHEHAGVGGAHRRARWGLYHVALLLPDRASLGAFLGHLAGVGERAGASDHLVSEALYLEDPDGLGIEVYADRPRETWRVEGREIAMTTRPLDAVDLGRAARGTRWDGLPAGTTVGHVHLHVGDLTEAQAFYHDGVGFDRVVWSYPGALFLSAGGYHHHLGLNTWAPGGPAGADEARLLDWEIRLPTPQDVRATAESLRSAGHDVVNVADGVRATDPWGTAVRVVVGRRDEARGAATLPA